MNFFLTIKHWQLFLIVVVISVAAQVNYVSNLHSNNTSLIILPFLAQFLPIFLWQWTTVQRLHKKISDNTKMNIVVFKLAIIGVFSAVFFIGFIAWKISTLPVTENILRYILPLLFIVPIAVCCSFYCLYFNAKILKSVELQKEADFSQYMPELMLLFFFAIGVWIIQPRINKIFSLPTPVSLPPVN